MKNWLFGLGVMTTFYSFSAGSGKQISKAEYVESWRTTAVQQMIQYNIPASITLAQGILESGSGNSDLAKKANNHFGIKCSDWDGETIYMDDDKKGECFRVYNSAEESYVDHSMFLTKRTRYSKLFELEKTDYKGWAKGLKEAGYATNPKYPEQLITLIEDLKLYELDQLGMPAQAKKPELLASAKNAKNKQEKVQTEHAVMLRDNKTKYIVAKKGDTYYRIAQEFGLTLHQLYKYNDFESNKDMLNEGDIVYIMPKKGKAKLKSVKLNEQMTVAQLAQMYGVKAQSLMKRNDLSSVDAVVSKGENITLR